MADAERPLGLFEGHGIEIEYMIVDRETLAVRPIADRVLGEAAGDVVAEVERGPLAWSNELALHVIELKTNGPAPSLGPLPAAFQEGVREVDALLEPHGARLMPTAMHPWMDPETETRLWPHEHGPVYRAFDRIFGCRGHGWSNLQSMHVNLPFADDGEFGRLHAAIRAALPLLPALAASSPLVEGRATGWLDNRMRFYRSNAARVPSVAGAVVPEPVGTRAAYEEGLLGRIYRDLAPLDPEGVLRHEWVNARGAIARFDRSAIEIRVLDSQEHAGADLAVAAAVNGLVRALAEGRWEDPARLDRLATERLAALLEATARDADAARVDDAELLRALGRDGAPRTAGELWRELADDVLADGPLRAGLEPLLADGPLARRVLRAVGPEPSRERLAEAYGELCSCLAEGRPFRP